jgi:thiosulfate dehydrogenase (quinone) large subunit
VKKSGKIIVGLFRIALGWLFLWAFFDKLWGLGYATDVDAAWVNGGSPTTGFLKFATSGPFAELLQGLAGSVVVDWLFMMGLLGIGVAYVLGIAMRAATYSGVVLVVLMYLAAIPPEHNPLIDEHIIYAFAFVSLYVFKLAIISD